MWRKVKRPIRYSGHPQSTQSSWLLSSVAKTIVYMEGPEQSGCGLEAYSVFRKNNPGNYSLILHNLKYHCQGLTVEYKFLITTLYKIRHKNNTCTIPDVNSSLFHMSPIKQQMRGESNGEAMTMYRVYVLSTNNYICFTWNCWCSSIHKNERYGEMTAHCANL